VHPPGHLSPAPKIKKERERERERCKMDEFFFIELRSVADMDVSHK
jgi:hypothetical protein